MLEMEKSEMLRRTNSTFEFETKEEYQERMRQQSRENLMGLVHHQKAMENLLNSVEGHDQHERRLRQKQLDGKLRLTRKLNERSRARHLNATSAGHTLLTQKGSHASARRAGSIMKGNRTSMKKRRRRTKQKVVSEKKSVEGDK